MRYLCLMLLVAGGAPLALCADGRRIEARSDGVSLEAPLDALYRKAAANARHAVTACMRRAGFVFRGRAPMQDPEDLMSEHDRLLTYGYGEYTRPIANEPEPGAVSSPEVERLSPERREAYTLALYGREDPARPDQPREGGCFDEGTARMARFTAVLDRYDDDRTSVFETLARDRRMVAVRKAWRRCMRSKGYRYHSPSEILADIRSRGRGGLSGDDIASLRAEELMIAAADADCRAQHVDAVARAVLAELRRRNATGTRKLLREARMVVNESRLRRNQAPASALVPTRGAT